LKNNNQLQWQNSVKNSGYFLADEYRQHKGKDPALARRFHRVEEWQKQVTC